MKKSTGNVPELSFLQLLLDRSVVFTESSGIEMNDGSVLDVGGIFTGPIGTWKDIVITAQNFSKDTVTFSNLSFDAGDFTLVSAPSSLQPDGISTFVIRFDPQSTGSKTTHLAFHLSPREKDFVFTFTGTGIPAPPTPDVFLTLDGNLNDSSGNKRDAVVSVGSVSYATNRRGELNKAAYGNGAMTLAINSFPTWSNATAFTAAFWIHTTGYNTFPSALCNFFERRGGNPSDLEFTLHMTTSEIRSGYGRFNVSWDSFVMFPPPISLNVWHHIAFVRHDSTTSSLYVDGIFRSVQSAATVASNTSTPVLLFNDGWGSYCTGSLDDFVIFPVAFTATEVNALYQQN